jgi:hypothetical protein
MAELGEEALSGPLTGATKAQRLYIANWDLIRRTALENGEWNFATERVILAADPTAPIFGPANRFALPADYIRLANVDDMDLNAWKIESNPAGGLWLLSDDDSTLNLKYIADKTDESLYSATFKRACALLAAELLHPSITQSESKRNATAGRAEGMLQAARLKETQDNSPEEWDVDVWLRSRV